MDMTGYTSEVALGAIVKLLDRDSKAKVIVEENGIKKQLLIESINGVFTKVNGKIIEDKAFFDYFLKSVKVLGLDVVGNNTTK